MKTKLGFSQLNISCEEFGKNILTKNSCSTIKSIPSQLKHSNKDLRVELIGRIKQGILPMGIKEMKKWEPLPFTYTGQHCSNYLHCFEAMPITSIKCNLESYYLTKKR